MDPSWLPFAKIFWAVIMVAVVVWYSTVTVYVAVKGVADIKGMLGRLQKINEEDAENAEKAARRSAPPRGAHGRTTVPSRRRTFPQRMSNDGSSRIGKRAASFSFRSIPSPGRSLTW